MERLFYRDQHVLFSLPILDHVRLAPSRITRNLMRRRGAVGPIDPLEQDGDAP